MRETKYHTYLDSGERSILLHSRLVSKPVGFFAFCGTLHSHLDKVAKFMRKEDASMSNCKVIALTNQKGGVNGMELYRGAGI